MVEAVRFLEIISVLVTYRKKIKNISSFSQRLEHTRINSRQHDDVYVQYLFIAVNQFSSKNSG